MSFWCEGGGGGCYVQSTTDWLHVAAALDFHSPTCPPAQRPDQRWCALPPTERSAKSVAATLMRLTRFLTDMV